MMEISVLMMGATNANFNAMPDVYLVFMVNVNLVIRQMAGFLINLFQFARVSVVTSLWLKQNTAMMPISLHLMDVSLVLTLVQ